MLRHLFGAADPRFAIIIGAVPAAARLSFRIHHNCADHCLFFEEPVCFGRLAERHLLGNVGAQSALL